jgi:hypothetical protein
MIEEKMNQKGNHKDSHKAGNLALVSMHLSKAKAHKVNRKKNTRRKRDRTRIHLKNPIRCQYKSQKIKLTTIENNPLKIDNKENLLESLFRKQIERKRKMNLYQTKRRASENQKVELTTKMACLNTPFLKANQRKSEIHQHRKIKKKRGSLKKKGGNKNWKGSNKGKKHKRKESLHKGKDLNKEEDLSKKEDQKKGRDLNKEKGQKNREDKRKEEDHNKEEGMSRKGDKSKGKSKNKEKNQMSERN